MTECKRCGYEEPPLAKREYTPRESIRFLLDASNLDHGTVTRVCLPRKLLLNFYEEHEHLRLDLASVETAIQMVDSMNPSNKAAVAMSALLQNYLGRPLTVFGRSLLDIQRILEEHEKRSR